MAKVKVVIYLPHYDNDVRKEYELEEDEELTSKKLNELFNDFRETFGRKYNKEEGKYVKTDEKLKGWWYGLKNKLGYILNVHSSKSAKGNAYEKGYKRWSKDEIKELKQLRRKRLKITEIAVTLKRSYDSVRTKIRRINFSKKFNQKRGGGIK